MKLLISDTHYSIEELFPHNIVLGFTTQRIAGTDPDKEVISVIYGAGNPSVAWCKQPHGSEITITEASGVFPTDGLITRCEQLVLVIRTADCLPLFLSDSESGLVGLVHLGWKSLDAGILKTLAGLLKEKKAGRITLAAGPGLRKCCYEVKSDFLSNSLAQFVEQRDEKYFFDPIRCVREQLSAQNIVYELHDIGFCTLCSPQRFHSWRRDKTEKRILSFMYKKEDGK